MRLRFFYGFLFFILVATNATGQIKAKAISYQLDVDLAIFAPQYAEQTETDSIDCRFEIDLYYTPEKVRTYARMIRRPRDYELTIRQRMYDIASKDEYNIDPANQYALIKKNQEVKLKATGKKKEIKGHACKEYTFTDHRNIGFSVWVAPKLQVNICPAGNFSLPGTALEITTSNGLHYVATDFADGELRADFFQLAPGFQQETLELKPADKKSK